MAPLMGLLALGNPLFAEPLVVWGQPANASPHHVAAESSSFFHPLAALLGLAAAGAASASHVQTHPGAVLGWDALRWTSLRGSVWMVRDRWMGRCARLCAPYSFLLRC